MAEVKFNEEFVKPYEESSLTTKFVIDDKAHVELEPVMSDAMLQAKKVREKMKDDFKEQDELVAEFLKASDLEENPKLPDIEDDKALKAMKLSESMLTLEDLEPVIDSQTEANMQVAEDNRKYFESLAESDPSVLTEDIPLDDLYDKYADVMDKLGVEESLNEDLNPSNIHDFIDASVPMERLGEMAYKWMTSQELTDMLEANGYDDWDQIDESVKLDEASVPDMIAAFKDKIDDLEGTNESLEESVELKEDYSNFIGRPLKDFLMNIDRAEKINIDCEEPAQGSNGMMGRANQVPWYMADRIVKDIQLGDENYYKFKVLTEDFEENKKKDLNEARKVSKFSYADDDVKHRYKVVAADADDKELFLKDTKGINKAISVLDELTDEKLQELGATQVYITRDDDKEIYLKFSNDDGTWDVIQDDTDLERPAEERDTIYNHIMADLNAESTPDQKALRKMSRDGEGYVGFDNDEIGFDEVEGKINLKSQSNTPINWAKKVADFYGYDTTEVKLGDDGYKYISIITPDIVDELKLTP